jgi:hypothetical protein
MLDTARGWIPSDENRIQSRKSNPIQSKNVFLSSAVNQAESMKRPMAISGHALVRLNIMTTVHCQVSLEHVLDQTQISTS